MCIGWWVQFQKIPVLMPNICLNYMTELLVFQNYRSAWCLLLWDPITSTFKKLSFQNSILIYQFLSHNTTENFNWAAESVPQVRLGKKILFCLYLKVQTWFPWTNCYCLCFGTYCHPLRTKEYMPCALISLH